MKLKQVLTEGPTTYSQGGQRYYSWEEPDDQPDEAEATEEVVNVPMTLSDGTKLGSKVRVSYTEEQDAGGRSYVQVHDVEVQSIILPTGQEVEPAVAAQQLGDEELNDDSIDYDVHDYFSAAFKGAKVEFDNGAVTPIGGTVSGGAAPAQAATPAPAATATPTAA